MQRDPRLNEILYPKLTRTALQDFLNQYEPDQKFRARDLIGLDGFTQYLMSDENAVMYIEHLGVHQDMNQPINNYFVNSSHNTYLVGRQYGGKSSVDMYRQVLIAGCRCVQVNNKTFLHELQYIPFKTSKRSLYAESESPFLSTRYLFGLQTSSTSHILFRFRLRSSYGSFCLFTF